MANSVNPDQNDPSGLLWPISPYIYGKFGTVVPTKSDSEVIFCLQLLSKH